MNNKILKILLGVCACFFISQAYGQSCSFKTQIKYLDGTVGCIEDLPLAKIKANGENITILEQINTTQTYALAVSKNLKCNSIGFSGGALVSVLGIRTAYEKALDICNKNGCECEVIINDGNAVVPKEVILASSSPSLAQSIKLIDNSGVLPEKKITLSGSSSCSFKTQIKYQDGSIGCIVDLPMANQVATGDTRNLVDTIVSAKGYAVARSKNLSCDAIAVETTIGNLSNKKSTQIRALEKCNSFGCDCEMVIADGNALVTKEVLLAGLSSPPNNSQIQTTNTNPSQPSKESSCSFKTKLKYQDGTLGCIEDLPIAKQIPNGETTNLLASISRGSSYMVALPINATDKGLGVSTLLKTYRLPTDTAALRKDALSACSSQGSICKIVIDDGNVLVPKDILLAGGSLSPPSNPSQAIKVADTKLNQSIESVSNTKVNSESCNQWNILRFPDGSQSCMTDYKFFTLEGPAIGVGGVAEYTKGRRNYSIAMVKHPNKCPTNWRGGSTALDNNQPKAIQNCQMENKNLEGCECELIYSLEQSNIPNIKVPKDVFENKIRGWEAYTQNAPWRKDELSLEERAANNKFFTEYKKRLDSQDNGDTKLAQIPVSKSSAGLTTNEAIAQQPVILDPKIRLAEANRLKQEEALQAATAQEKLKLELAQKQNEQQELAKKQQLEKEQKLAEEKRVQQELAKQQQLEKEQKLAEQKRLQVEMAAKAQTEKEQKLAEEKRKQDEFVAKIQAEKEQKELALRQKKEADQQAQAQLAAQAPKASYVGKRLALVIGNSKYTQRPLDNAVNDANDVSKALKNTGFEVIDVRDATLSQMRTALRQFGDKLLNNDVGLVYYSGHGVEVKGRNYFIPVNADIKRSDEIADQSLDVGLVLDKMETAQKAVNILIVDACRDDPFGRSFRSGSRGLATMDAPQGTIIAFATSPGKVAADGDGRNSPYTKNLVVAMQEPNLPIEQVFKQVRRAVQKETKGQQTPWENTSLSGDFYFKVQK